MRVLSIATVLLLGSALSAASAQQPHTAPTAKRLPTARQNSHSETGNSKAAAGQVKALRPETAAKYASGGSSNVVPLKGLSGSGPNSFVSGGSDTCGTATAISGNGPFAGDNIGAGTDGPDPCGVAMGADVWYDWTASVSGVTTFSLCGSSYDTSIAIYDGAGCVGPNLACNDDSCGVQSNTSATVVGGNVYKIQVGGFASSQGNYTLTITPPAAGGPCDTYDDGSSETGVGFNATTGTDILWMHKQGQVGGCANVTSISTAYGTPAFPGAGPANGSAARVGIWQDTDNDGNPTTGMVLLQVVNTTVANTDTNILNVVPLSPAVQVNGIYFVGASTSGRFPAPLDNSVAGGGRSWIAGSTTGNGTIDYNNLNASGFPPTNEDSIAAGVWLLHSNCGPCGLPNDSCATPTVVVGNGPFPWTNVTATTDGGAEFCGTPRQDVWYTWNATCTGTATFSLCVGGLTPDTVIAAYNGAGCPVPGSAIACDDDTCSSPAFGTSQCTFACTAGQDYTLRIGGFGSTTGSGSFEVTCFTPPPPGPCDQYDDGSSETGVGFNATTGTDILWMHRQGGVGLSTVVSSISTAYGTPTFPGAGPANGSASRIGIWQDTDNDGNPTTGMVLLQVVNATVANTDTNTLNVVPLSPPVVVQGTYFIGASTSGRFPAPLDTSVAGGGRSWIAGSTTGNGSIDYNNLNASGFPPTNEDSIAAGVWLLRADCDAKGTIESFCAGDASAGATPCPCGNQSLSTDGRGCANDTPGSGSLLTATGAASVTPSNDTLQMSSTGHHLSAGLAILWQGIDLGGTPVQYGDGLRCFGSPARRIYIFPAPANTDPLVTPTPPFFSLQSGPSLNPGDIRVYQLAYRDPTVGFGCTGIGDTFNSSNAIRVVWNQ